jgi:hypothetical protein
MRDITPPFDKQLAGKRTSLPKKTQEAVLVSSRSGASSSASQLAIAALLATYLAMPVSLGLGRSCEFWSRRRVKKFSS